MLATIRDDTWNVRNMQHIIPNSKRNGIIQTSPVVAIYIQGLAHIVEGGHHLRKAPNPHTVGQGQIITSHGYCGM